MFPLINKRETGIRLRQIIDRLGFSARDVQEYLGLGCVQSVYRWLDGHSMPTVDNLYALSELFQMPMDEIVCGNRAPLGVSSAAASGMQDTPVHVYSGKKAA
ncbi:MAG: helix-turn-helix transcriptional regulator [Lachnospiraceae bacterium]|nr:helix-turn-helix transcriptional regulator [Lachnospiraceae bacterium]MBQ8548836.1 helix-turn-helix transcriptional regulator [Lachnospiraceae bacterium]